MSAQKVIITLTDKGDGKVGCNLDFNPPIKPTSKTTPAIAIALEMVEAISAKCSATIKEVK